MVPARVENLKYNRDFNGLFKDNSSDSEVNCSVVKITWDPPSNYNETAIDHYEVTVHVGPGNQHVINVINTEWTFIPSDHELASLAIYSVATNLLVEDIQFNVSVSTVNICGQNGTANTIQITELICYHHNHDLYTTVILYLMDRPGIALLVIAGILAIILCVTNVTTSIIVYRASRIPGKLKGVT